MLMQDNLWLPLGQVLEVHLGESEKKQIPCAEIRKLAWRSTSRLKCAVAAGKWLGHNNIPINNLDSPNREEWREI